MNGYAYKHTCILSILNLYIETCALQVRQFYSHNGPAPRGHCYRILPACVGQGAQHAVCCAHVCTWCHRISRVRWCMFQQARGAICMPNTCTTLLTQCVRVLVCKRHVLNKAQLPLISLHMRTLSFHAGHCCCMCVCVCVCV